MSSGGQILGGIGGAIIGGLLGGPTGALYGAQIGITAGGIIDPPRGQTRLARGSTTSACRARATAAQSRASMGP